MQRVVCLGGGPAGLYSSILLKKALPKARIEVYERNRPDDTFGWGVVFSDKTMAGFRDADPETHDAIVSDFHHWDDIVVHFRGAAMRSGGHGFCGIERKHLLNIMQDRARALGVEQTFEYEVDPDQLDRFSDADLIIASDGVNSRIRTKFAAAFQPQIDVRKCRFIWLGTRQKFPAFTFAFEQAEHGWFQIHAYQFSADLATVIVETREETWLAHGLDKFDSDQSIAFCERLFGKYLDGHKLMSNARHLRGSAWLNFNRVLCEKWHHQNIVLIGDAAHTAHFGIGSGTKLAMEDAISLVQQVTQAADVRKGLETYQTERSLEALKLQSAARNRMEWFENVARYVHQPPPQFAYNLLTGSQRIGHANLRLRDAPFVDDYERWFAKEQGVAATPRPPMFLPLTLAGLTVANRVIVSPMAQYKAIDGSPNDWHLVDYGARALGGAGLMFTEMTCVSPVARITPGCLGLWNDEQGDAWRRLVDFVHQNSSTKICMQLGHSGRKGSTQLGWEEIDHPLPQGNWPLLSASPLPYLPGVSQIPKEMTRADMDVVRDQFVAAAQRALRADFDMLELHYAHGYLLASFLSPLTNVRTDEYGGAVANRLRYPLEVFSAVRAVWPRERPLSVRLSATDWAPGGLSEADLIAIASAFKQAGADILDVSTGQTVPDQQPIYGRMYQTPLSDQIRNEVGIATIAVGNIYESDHVNTIIAAGRADLCALARPHLANPAWTLHAAAEQHYEPQHWPAPYLNGKAQLERNLERAALMVGPV
ncbi:MAG TPA: bifunctional salicylyl-CoA 5-hydroxylase/oxidoreductase [Steroidobacteraceae bacterium]|nr:bifunctional salicylyl-CoA 5-hydroxylase/oxidoreductase [Steroidobacteraceae bacterium]